MAELGTSTAGSNNGGITRKKASTRVDLTAMVDLAFLLITFFILTTTLQKPLAMDLIMPDKSITDDHMIGADSRTMTVLLGIGNKVEWYMGMSNKPLTAPSVVGFDKNGIRKALMEQSLKIKQEQGKTMMVVIKPSDKSKYDNMVNLMDELNIINNQQRAIVDITADEIALLKRDGIY